MVLAGFGGSAQAASTAGYEVSEFPVVVRSGDQESPRLDVATVIFRDTSPDRLVRLMKMPLLGGAEEELVPGGVMAGPDSDGGAFAWQSNSGGVCMRPLAGGDDRCVSSGSAVDLSFSGMRVITEAGGTSRISLVDFDTMRSRILDSSTLPGMRYDPAIEGDKAVWVKERGYAGRYYEPLLVSHDITTGASVYLNKTGGGSGPGGGSRYERKSPTIDGGRVFYQQRDALSNSDWDIVEAVPDTFGTPVAGVAGDQVNPAASGNLVVFQDNRSGYRDESGKWEGDWDIYVKDLKSGIEQPVCNAPGNQRNPVIKGNVVLWEDDRNGDWDIYAAFLTPGGGDEELMQRFAPLLVMHSEEDFAPVSTELMVALPGTVLMEEGSERLRSPDSLTLAALGGFGPGSHIDLPAPCLYCGGHEPSATIDRYTFSQYVKPYREAVDSGGYGPAVYGRIVDRDSGRVIQYWLNYLFNNHPLLSHEGDWELIEVELDENDQPVRVSASQHDYGRMRMWQDVESQGDRPVIYVARGSHANYFEPADHYISISGIPVPLALDFTDTIFGGRPVVPDVIALSPAAAGSGSQAWLDFGGQWGEPSDRMGGDAPVGPKWSGGRWSQPLAWDGLHWDGFAGLPGRLAGLEARASRWVNIEVFDRFGELIGPVAGVMAAPEQAGMRYIDNAELGQKAALVTGGVPTDAYRIELSAGSETIRTAVELSFPDAASGTVVELRYEDVPVGGGSRAWLEAGAGAGAPDYPLFLDADGDGGVDSIITPAGMDSHVADLLAPGSVTDLMAARSDDGSVRLTFAAPGDDGNQGKASAYTVRYSTEPINEENWHLAEPADVGTQPLEAGASESLSVHDLPDGDPLYFGVRAIDEAGNSGELSVTAAAAQPRLSLAAASAAWDSYADYASGILTVEFTVSNRGGGAARSLNVRQVLTAPGNIAWLPGEDANLQIEPAATARFSLRFSVPAGCYRFRAVIYATCVDAAGQEMSLPGPPPR